MAARFWVNTAGGTWDNATTSNWSATTGGASGASVPVAGDTVTFDNNSGANIVTTNYNVAVATITLGTVNLFAGTLSLGGTLTTTGAVTIGSGTFKTNGFTASLDSITCAAITNTRALDITNSTVNIGGTGTVWQTGTVTGLTFTATGSTINLTNSSATSRAWGMGNGNIFNNINVTAGTGTFNFANGTATIAGSLDFSGYTGNWQSGVGFNLMGNLTLGRGMSFTDGAAVVTMNGSGTQTITTNGNTGMRGITVNNSGTVTLADDLVINSARTFTVTAGTFTANNKNVTAGLFNLSNSNTRNITMGTGTWFATGTGTVWTTATQTGLTLNVTGSTIDVTDISATTKTFAGGIGGTLNNVIFRGGAITWNNTPTTYNTVTIYANSTVITNSAPTTKTFNNLITYATPGNVITFVSSSPGTAYTFSQTSGRVVCDYLSLRDCIATGGAQWYAGSHSTNVSGNTGWLFQDNRRLSTTRTTASTRTQASTRTIATTRPAVTV
jgi:hypothetical protein